MSYGFYCGLFKTWHPRGREGSTTKLQKNADVWAVGQQDQDITWRCRTGFYHAAKLVLIVLHCSFMVSWETHLPAEEMQHEPCFCLEGNHLYSSFTWDCWNEWGHQDRIVTGSWRIKKRKKEADAFKGERLFHILPATRFSKTQEWLLTVSLEVGRCYS